MRKVRKESNDEMWFKHLSNTTNFYNDELRNQYLSLYQRNKELINSLSYAEVIQKGILPKERHFQRLFDDAFVFYQPQSYVSGDFYWMGEIDNHVLFAVGDCTGHGVPGALLTMLAQSFLNYLILGKKTTHPTLILNEFDKKFIETFMGEQEDVFQNDWIDIALCSLDRNNQTLKFAGAKRKILHVSNGTFNTYNGSNYPIGGWQIENKRNFNHLDIKVSKGDMIYLGSDGYQDQIGGDKNKKFGSKQLHQELLTISELNGKEQLSHLKNVFHKWKKNADQLDDICIMGIRF